MKRETEYSGVAHGEEFGVIVVSNLGRHRSLEDATKSFSPGARELTVCPTDDVDAIADYFARKTQAVRITTYGQTGGIIRERSVGKI